MTTGRDINDLPANKRVMQFIENIRENLGFKLREFGRILKISHQLLGTWIDGAHKMREFITAICKLRKLSGKSWNHFGEILDDEFLSEKEWNETLKNLKEETARKKKRESQR